MPAAARFSFFAMTILNELPAEHVLRNLPLGEIGAEYLAGHPPTWRSLKKFRIGARTFNELGPAWTESGARLFRAPDPWPRYYRANDVIRRLIRRQKSADEKWIRDNCRSGNGQDSVCPISGGYRAAAPLYPAHDYLHALGLLEPSPRAVQFSWVDAPNEKIIDRVRKLLTANR